VTLVFPDRLLSSAAFQQSLRRRPVETEFRRAAKTHARCDVDIPMGNNYVEREASHSVTGMQAHHHFRHHHHHAGHVSAGFLDR
jgi:hypothetical protein